MTTHIMSALLQAIAHCVPPNGATTLNPSVKQTGIALTNGNLTATASGAVSGGCLSTTSKSSGKFYIEATYVEGPSGTFYGFGIADTSYTVSTAPGTDVHCVIFQNAGVVRYDGSNKAEISEPNANDVVAMAVDFGAQLIWFKNLTQATGWNEASGSSNPASGTGGVSFSSISAGAVFAMVGYLSDPGEITVNFGDTSFTGSVPAGFSAWD